MDEYISATLPKLQVVCNVSYPGCIFIYHLLESDAITVLPIPKYYKNSFVRKLWCIMQNSLETAVFPLLLYSCEYRQDMLFGHIVNYFWIDSKKIIDYCGKKLMNLFTYCLPNAQQYVNRFIKTLADIRGTNPKFIETYYMYINDVTTEKINAEIRNDICSIADDAVLAFLSENSLHSNDYVRYFGDKTIPVEIITKLLSWTNVWKLAKIWPKIQKARGIDAKPFTSSVIKRITAKIEKYDYPLDSDGALFLKNALDIIIKHDMTVWRIGFPANL